MEQTYSYVTDNQPPEMKEAYWQAAFGLQEVDNLRPSEYLTSLAAEHVEGKKTYTEVSEEIASYHHGYDSNNDATGEADAVSTAIYAILADQAFRFDYQTLKNYHAKLFEKLDPRVFHPGEFRKVNLTKAEDVLQGDTVTYQDFHELEQTLKYDFDEERAEDYARKTEAERVARLAEFTSRIWQVHPFYEGNTRTTAVFIEKYLRFLGYEVDNSLFRDHSRYFRDALVRANYANLPKNVTPDKTYLIRFFENLLLGKGHELESKALYI